MDGWSSFDTADRQNRVNGNGQPPRLSRTMPAHTSGIQLFPAETGPSPYSNDSLMHQTTEQRHRATADKRPTRGWNQSRRDTAEEQNRTTEELKEAQFSATRVGV